MGKTHAYNGVTVGPVMLMLFRLGYEPAVKAYGGPDRLTTFNSFNSGKKRWIRGDAKCWASVTKKLVVSNWGRQCLDDIGLPPYEAWQAAWQIAKNDNLRKKLAERIYQEHQLSLNSIRAQVRRVQKEKSFYSIKLPPGKAKMVLDLKEVAKHCKHLHQQFKQCYLDRVKEAEDRKRAWLTPLMWEALYNQQHHRHDRNKKIDFYKRAKATSCFDCGKQFAPATMTYDHLRDKDFTLGHLRQTEWRISWRRLHQEIGKCDVVCRDCHDIREYLRGTHNFAWGDLTPEVRERVNQMCYLERETLFHVVTRENKNPPVFDAESIRQTQLHWIKLQKYMHLDNVGTIRRLSFWEKVGLAMKKSRSLDKP